MLIIKKYILTLVKGPTQGLTAEVDYSINCTEQEKKFCLSLYYNGSTSYLFVNGVKIYQIRAKDSQLVLHPMCLGNISQNFLIDNMIDTGLNGYFYNFSTSFGSIDADVYDHCIKSVCIQSYSGPYFPAFGLNMERYSVSLGIQSECGKIRTRITPNTDTFYAVDVLDIHQYSMKKHNIK